MEQDVEWQPLDVLVREANSRLEERRELEVEEVQSKDPPNPAFVLRDGQSFAVEEKLVPKVVFVTMSDNKQQQPQPPQPQPQQQTTAVLDQNVQEIHVQVSLLESYPHPIRKQCFKFCIVIKQFC